MRRQARYYRRMHGKAVEREKRLKHELQAARAKLKELRQRLRERWARRSGSEQRTRSAGGTEAAATAPPRRRGQQPGAPGHGRRQHAHLPVQVEAHDVDPDRRRCPACGDEYRAHGSEDSEQLEIEVRAYRRVIKRRRYRRSCQCAAAPALSTAPAVPRLIAKGILGISLWVTVLIDKYLLYRPTYRLLADLRAHGLDLAQGTVTDGLRRLAPLFVPLREALIARSRTAEHWHADETRWQVFEASSEDACHPLVSVGVLEGCERLKRQQIIDFGAEKRSTYPITPHHGEVDHEYGRTYSGCRGPRQAVARAHQRRRDGSSGGGSQDP